VEAISLKRVLELLIDLHDTYAVPDLGLYPRLIADGSPPHEAWETFVLSLQHVDCWEAMAAIRAEISKQEKPHEMAG